MGVYSALEGEFDYEVVEDFICHFSLMTESMENLIQGLAHAPYYRENINQLFRIFHNIKSATGYLKITAIHKLVSLVEEILEECRVEEGEGSQELISWLLLVSDQLTLYREDLEVDAECFSPFNPHIIKVPIKFIRN
jgi:two-component system chemotaxis sensor kinase CheA